MRYLIDPPAALVRANNPPVYIADSRSAVSELGGRLDVEYSLPRGALDELGVERIVGGEGIVRKAHLVPFLFCVELEPTGAWIRSFIVY